MKRYKKRTITISIIIPNYNGLDLLKENLPYVINLKERWSSIIEIIIVDDASTDGSVNYINRNFPNIILIPKDKNSGFIDSVNLGVSKAVGDLVMLINTDVKPSEDIIPILVEYFSKDDTFAVGCLDKSYENDKVIERGRGIGIFNRGFLYHKRGNPLKSDTLWVSGGSSIYRKNIWNRLGGMDNIYNPFYWEDIDISYRALKAGYKIYYEHRAQVTHEHWKGAIIKGYGKDSVRLISLRNQFIFVWKNISDPKYLFEHFINLPFYLIKSLITFDMIFMKAFLSAIMKLNVVIKHRLDQKKYWLNKDRFILSQFSDEYLGT